MSVNFDGATSGNREDGRPPKDPAYDKQVPQDTASNSCSSYGVNWGPQPTGNREKDASPQVPCNGSPDDSAV